MKNSSAPRKKKRTAATNTRAADVTRFEKKVPLWQAEAIAERGPGADGMQLQPSLNEMTGFYPGLSAIVHEMSESFGRAIDAKDHFTKNHSDEVAIAAQALALQMGLSPKEADIIHIAGHLHDIGKIGVPDSVLNKTSALNDEEWRLIKKHPTMGAAILSPVRAMACMGVPELVLCHHERFDGTGYPRGLKGEQIPMAARIISLADSLSATLQERPYRKCLDFNGACEEIERGAGTQFDPKIVKIFLMHNESVRRLLHYVRTTSSSPLTLV